MRNALVCGLGVVGAWSMLGASAGAQCQPDLIAEIVLRADPGGVSEAVFDGVTAVVPQSGAQRTHADILEKVAGEWVLTQGVSGSDTQLVDYFGNDVAIDGSRVLIGAYQRTENGQEQAGAAYIFDRVGGVWQQTAKLLPSDDGQLFFGNAVALDGDRAIIFSRDVQLTYRGAVYVFERVGSDWIQTAKVQPSGIEDDDSFGRCLALWGDIMIASAPGDDDLAQDAGAIYVFKYIDGVWEQIDKVTADVGGLLGVDPGLWTAQPGTIVCCPYTGDDFKVFIFEYQAGAWSISALPNPRPGEGLSIGRPTLDGDRLFIVGCSIVYPEVVFRYERVGGEWTLVGESDGMWLPAVKDDLGLAIDSRPPGNDGDPSRAQFWEMCSGSCAVDWNADGEVDSRDVLGFLNAWTAGEAEADFNGDGAIDTRDVLDFLVAWTGGC